MRRTRPSSGSGLLATSLDGPLLDALGALGPELRTAVATRLVRVEVPDGAAVVREGDRDRTMFVILDGVAEAVRGGVVVARMPPGQHFGELGLKAQGFVSLVFGVLIVEDLAAILILVLLTTIATAGALSGGTLVFATLRLGFFLLLWFLVGIYFVPALLQRIRRLLSDETLLVVAIVVVWVIMVFVVPAFKEVFTSFGADLPAPTLMVMAISDFFVSYWWLMFLILGGVITAVTFLFKRSEAFRFGFDRLILRAPVIGEIIRKATIARWTRTLSTMFAAGVPLVESLDAVAGASGNALYAQGTRKIQTDVATGTSLTNAMTATNLFPTMVLQMTQIGEESGSLDGMLGKIADFFEREVDDAVAALSSLLEPIIIVFLGVVIGGLVIAMYLPIFKLGSVV